jgi:hypothetical protein
MRFISAIAYRVLGNDDTIAEINAAECCRQHARNTYGSRQAIAAGA